MTARPRTAGAARRDINVIVKPGDVVTTTIVTMDDEGRGRAPGHSPAEMDLCVRGAFIGDTVRAQVERVFPTSGVAQARALEIVQDGGCHTERVCPHRAPCPGCPLHGLRSEVALDLKRARVQMALAHNGVDAFVNDVAESAGPRQKVKLVVESFGGEDRVGLYVPHSHIIADADRCPHHRPEINVALQKLRPYLHTPVRAIIARSFVEGVGVVLVVDAPLVGDTWRAIGALALEPPIASVSVRFDETAPRTNSLLAGEIVRFVGPQTLTPLEGGAPVAVDAFCQPDPVGAARMYTRTAAFLTEGDLIHRSSGASLRGHADLYAGSGGFSRALLAKGATDVVAVERSRTSATALAALGVRAVAASVEDSLAELAAREWAGIVVDPPRKGLGELAPHIAALRAGRVVVVACDPDAGARDARVFVDAGYRLYAVEPLDLFPGTPEVETMFLLERA